MLENLVIINMYYCLQVHEQVVKNHEALPLNKMNKTKMKYGTLEYEWKVFSV